MTNLFDNAATEWDNKPGRTDRAKKFANDVKGIIKKENYRNAMEYGCGTGSVSFFLKDDFSEITLADSSEGMLEVLREKIDLEKINHFHPVFINLEKEDHTGKYDLIYTLMTLHHVKSPRSVLKKFREILNPGGMLIIGDLEKEDGDFHEYPESLEVHFGFDRQYLEKELTQNGLQPLHYEVFCEMEKEKSGKLKKYPVFLLAAKLSNN